MRLVTRPRGSAPEKEPVVLDFSLTHLSNHALTDALAAAAAQARTALAVLVAHLAEFDVRRLYLEAGYSSLHAYCVEALRMSEDCASKRITAARKAREFPMILEALADGRLHLSGVVMLSHYLTSGNGGELLSAAVGKTKAEIERLLAARFPKTELMPLVEALPSRGLGPTGAGTWTSIATASSAPGRMQSCAEESARRVGEPSAPARIEAAPELSASAVSAPGRMTGELHSRATPHAAGRFALHLVFGQDAYDLLCRAQELLGHRVPSGDVAQVMELALRELVGKLEKQTFGATDKPRPRSRTKNNPRYIPKHVRRAVWTRDGGQCTYLGPSGHRCTARRRLEFDHVIPIARGGESTVENLQLKCRAHNLHQAERMFGADFMEQKRRGSRAQSPAVGHSQQHIQHSRPVVAPRQTPF